MVTLEGSIIILAVGITLVLIARLIQIQEVVNKILYVIGIILVVVGILFLLLAILSMALFLLPPTILFV